MWSRSKFFKCRLFKKIIVRFLFIHETEPYVYKQQRKYVSYFILLNKKHKK